MNEVGAIAAAHTIHVGGFPFPRDLAIAKLQSAAARLFASLAKRRRARHASN